MKISALFATAFLALAMMASGAHAQAAQQQVSNNGPIRGDSFMRGMKNPSELAALIEANLKTDSTGRSLLSPEKCHQATEKSCGSAWAYLMMFQIADKKSKDLGLLDRVDQLPAYLHSLVPDKVARNEEWFMACMAPVGDNVFDPVSDCMARIFTPNELAWKSPTGVDVMAGDCTNPLFGRSEPIIATAEPCIRISVARPAGTQVVHWEVTPDNLGSRCWSITQAGNIRTKMTDQCPDKNCTFASGNDFLVKHEEELGYQVVIGANPRMGSFVPIVNDKEGVDVYSVPSSIKKGGSLNVCITVKMADGTFVTYKVKHLFFHETDKGSAFATHTPWMLTDDTN